ncbi:MAG: alpha-L-rhamnosidase C-terminal domain-containing protein [Kiritimatiellae bacterium]|nr:alpha-L-rhamnosidase C-terminal domain-containing protein [Kiritimatiellia bacterium]
MNKTSLMEQACWIWPGALHENGRNVYADFRHDFQVKRRKGKARLFITADQCYMLYFNGEYAGRGPARGYQASWPCDEFDLSEYVRPGHNWISVRVYNAGCSTFQYLHQSACGLICAGEAGGVEILSGEKWRGRLSPANRRDTARLSVQLNYQEWIDARLDDQAWINSARRPAGWKSPAVKRPFGCMPWHSLEPRGIPNLGHEVLAYQRLAARGLGRADARSENDANLTLPWFRELARIRWERLNAAGDFTILPALANDGLQAVVFDMGRPAVGTLIVDAAGARGGEILDFFYCEVLSAAGAPVLADPEKGSAMAMSGRLILRKGRTRHEFFQMMGHRYVTVIARRNAAALKIGLRLRETIYPMAVRAFFYSGDEKLNAIYGICRQTQRVCALDSYVDTPWREQAQWWGDARVQAQNTFHLSADTRLLARGIRSIARQEVPNGLTYGHAPTAAHGCILPDFSLTWLLTIWDYYFQSGNVSLFHEQYARIEKVLDYFRGEGRSANGLLRFDRRYWLFLDWSDLDKAGNPALLNLWYVLALEKTAKLAGLAKMPAEQRKLAREYDGFCRKVIGAFWDGKLEMFCDGLDEKGRRVGKYSVHAQTLAILCGLKKRRHKAMFEKLLLPYARGKNIPGSKPSSYWVNYVYEVLKRAGYGAEAVRHIRKNWTPMIPSGGTWEVFASRSGVHSVTHAWAAHPLYHLAGTLGGILQKSAGWKEIIFRPVIMPEYGFIDCAVPTPLGIIKSRWEASRNKAEVALELPAGVRAGVFLPGIKEQCGGKNKWRVALDKQAFPFA